MNNSEPTFAEFYFKCSEHTSLGESDQAVPLYLIRPNLRDIPCLACADIRYNFIILLYYKTTTFYCYFFNINPLLIELLNRITSIRWSCNIFFITKNR